MAEQGYAQFCPVAMASEILCTRWTMLVLRELLAGSTRFNELRRGLPRMSPALLSKRLKELEAAGILRRSHLPGDGDLFEYRLTPAGLELQSLVETIGVWGQRWVETAAALERLDPDLLMWDMRRNLNPKPMPNRRNTIQFIFADQAQARQNWWLVAEPGAAVDLCFVDPGFEVDLYLETDLRTMTEIWMGYTPLARAKDKGKLTVTGDRQLETSLKSWLGLSAFAGVKRQVA